MRRGGIESPFGGKSYRTRLIDLSMGLGEAGPKTAAFRMDDSGFIY